VTAHPLLSISSTSHPTPEEVGLGKARPSRAHRGRLRSLEGSIDGAAASPNAIGLIGAQVTHNTSLLGTVRAVLTSAAGQVVGVEIEGLDGRWSLLPLAAALIGPDSIEANPLTLLQLGEVEFYLQNGARRSSVANRGGCDGLPGHTRVPTPPSRLDEQRVENDRAESTDARARGDRMCASNRET
jgi:hypothetical protein